ncbi:MAG: CBS domain-containing protein [Aquificaceae bacterium]|nr:CBS domain-containing protein [Aquificaceae bacterium]
MQKVVFLEEDADLDALSSAYCVTLLHQDACIFRPQYLSRKASEVLTKFENRFCILNNLPDSFDLVLVDSHNYQDYLERFKERIREIYIYDHHPQAPTHFKGKVESVGSCTTLLVEELIKQGLDIDPESATLLALGIYEDTGMLTYEGTTPRDVRAVAWLLEKGANLRLLRNLLSGGISKEDIDLLSKHMTGLENLFIEGKRVCLVVLRAEQYSPDILSLIYQLKDIRESSAFFAVVEAGNKTYLFGRSVRGEFDVSEVLRKFGGGGHEFASAVKLEGVSGERLKSLLKSMLMGKKVPLRVGEVMACPPFLIHQDMDAELALFELTQRNFAGAPVVDTEGNLVGVVYKKSLLRAHKHGVKGKVRDFMVEDFHTLEPEDFVWNAEEVLSRYGEKLVPVVKDGKVVGVITRLDLLHTYREQVKELRALEKRIQLPEEIRPLLENLGSEAMAMGYKVYLVGGVVRDLLMKRSLWDMDIVVEGNAIELALKLSSLWGVQAHTFPEFGTAHMKVKGHKIELATTRRETYPHPGAYPVVEPATLKEDLLRRDFTINAMAISINPEDFGTLVDYFGGLRDLKDGILRVLHPVSFVEDPVRMLRALRFAGRFGFRLSKGTEKLLKNALEAELLKRSPRGRVLNELRLALREERLIDILRLYRKYHILEQVIEGFTFSPQLETLLENLKEVISWHKIEFPQERLDYGWVYLILLIKDLKEGDAFLKDISAPAWVRESYRLLKEQLYKIIPSLQKAQKNSEVYLLLKGKPEAFLLILMLYQKEKVRLYMEKLRYIKIDTGKFKDLKGKELGEAIEREKLRLMDAYSSER